MGHGLCRGADLLLGEAFGTLSDYSGNYQVIKHALAVHLGELAQRAEVSRVIPFHMHPRYGSNPAKREELLAEIRRTYGGQIIWPDELITVNL